MSDANIALITRFYQAFQRLDAEAMVACYSPEVVFSDPAFGTLRGKDAADMWRMLASRAKDFSLTFDSVRADERSATAHWWPPTCSARPVAWWSTTSRHVS